MTDEQAVREWLQGWSAAGAPNPRKMLALLDAKDAELREYKEALAFTESERDEALSRAEQAEAALAEERKAHQAFREEVSEACHNARYYAGDGEFLNIPEVKRILERFILPAKPVVDPLVAAYVEHTDDCLTTEEAEVYVAALRAAIERAGGTISFEGEG